MKKKRIKQETVSTEILQWLLICPTTDSALRAISSSRYSYFVIKNLKKNELIRGDVLVEEKEKKQKTIRSSFISPAGIRYLIDEALRNNQRPVSSRKNMFPFLNLIPAEDTKHASVIPEQIEKDRAIAVGEAATIAYAAGATVPLFIFDDEIPVKDVSAIVITTELAFPKKQELDESQYSPEQLAYKKMEQKKREQRRKDPRIATAKTVNELVEKAVSDWRKTEGDSDVTYYHLSENINLTQGSVQTEYHPESEDYIRFVNPTTVKIAALLSENETENAHDTNRGRFAGLLQSRVRTLLMYPTFKTTFSWSSGLVNAERTADVLWKKQLLPEFALCENEGTCGAMLFPTAAQFVRLWKAQTRGRKLHPSIGSSFSHMYVTEISRQGAEILRQIMLTTSDDHYTNEMKRVLNEKFSRALGYRFVRTTETEYAPLFPVKVMLNDGVWYYFFFGTWFDLKEIYSVMEKMAADTDFGVGVICEPWQHEYYKRIMPEVLTYWEGKTMAELDNDDC